MEQKKKLKKTLKDLTLKDNFMFCAVMMVEENCRSFLEACLGFLIGHLRVDQEKSMIWHPEYRSVRLDVYARDDENRRYNVEMQVAQKPFLAKRKRYYQSQMDMELLRSGHGYGELPDTYVIFVCDFDPFGCGRYLYTFENCCLENGELKLNDGCRSLFLSTYGRNPKETPHEIVSFLECLKTGKTTELAAGTLTGRLQASMEQIKKSREMEDKFMTIGELIEDDLEEARAEGRAEGREEGMIIGKAQMILDLLQDKGSVSKTAVDRVLKEKNPAVLKEWICLAVQAESVPQFEEAIQ